MKYGSQCCKPSFYKVMDNLEHILAIELMNAAQGLDFRRPLRSSPFIEKFLATYRNEVPFIKEDIVMYKEIHKTVAFFKTASSKIIKRHFGLGL